MSYVTVLWSVAAAAAALLGVVHFLIWVLDRRALANLAFALAALSLVGIAATELGMMVSQTPEQWAFWVRTCHLPLFIHLCSMVVFVRLYLGTGRTWLLGLYIATRCLIVLANFAMPSGFNFERIDSIERIEFLGEWITVVGDAVPGRWQWFATLSNVLELCYIVDAAATLWRSGAPEARRRAAFVGGSIFACAVFATIYVQLVIWGYLHLPILITPAFLITLSAMAFELSRDTLHASRLARDLQESQRRLDLAAGAAGLGLWIWDVKRNQIWATDRARGLFGIAPADPLTFDRLAPIVHGDDALRIQETLSYALTRETEYSVQFRVRLPEGSERWIAARGRSECDERGRPSLVRGVLHDVTDQRRAQNEADELRRELAHSGRVTMLGQLSSALAHELAQPLSAILRNAEAAEILLEHPAPDLDELRAIVTDIHRDDRRAGEVIERLRALLKRRSMEFHPLAVGSLVDDVSSLVRSDALARHVTLECATAAALPMVAGDRVHLSQVLINLIINAMDATNESTQSARRVTVEAQSGPDHSIEVAVTDSGAGIPPERMNKIFEPFFTTKAGGMGMGLAVSRTIIEAHGGRLWAENCDRGGATFRFRLPAIEGLAA